MDTELTALRGLGLSSHEAAIYLALVKLGPSPASSIAVETGLQRTAAYPILRGLSERGIVNVYLKKGKQIYQAQRPERVASYYQRKLKTFEDSIPALRALITKENTLVGLRFLETKKELKAFYQDILEEYSRKQKKDRSYRILGSATDWEGIDNDFFIWYRKERGKAQIHTSLLLTHDSQTINPADPDLLRTYKYLPKEYAFKSTIDIFDEKILIVNPSPSSLAVVIEVPAMVDVFKAIFDITWNLMPEVKQN